MLIRLSVLLFFTLLVTPARGEELQWKKYQNARFGFVLAYPAGLSGKPEPENGGGREFQSADEKFSVAASAHFFHPDIGDTFEKRWQEELDTRDVNITYRKKAPGWYVVSGVARDGTEFYHKLFRKGSNWAAFQITYPHAQNKKYDLWVEQIAKRFIPFLEGDFDRID